MKVQYILPVLRSPRTKVRTDNSLLERVCFQGFTAKWDSSKKRTIIWYRDGQISWPLLLKATFLSAPTHSMTYLLEESWHFHHFFSPSSGWLPALAKTAAGCNHWSKLTELCELLLLHCVPFRNLLGKVLAFITLDLGGQRPLLKDIILVNPYTIQSQRAGLEFIKDVTMVLY